MPMCRRVGNTNKLGAMFGILSAIGAPVPSPGSPTFFIRLAVNAVRSFISGASLTLYRFSSQFRACHLVDSLLNTTYGPSARWLRFYNPELVFVLSQIERSTWSAASIVLSVVM